MIVTVRHLTHYTFDQTVRAVALSLRAFPVDTDSQSILDWNVKIDGATFGSQFTDGCGNVLQSASIFRSSDGYTVEITGRAETRDTAGILRGLKEKTAPQVWCRSTDLTASDAAIRKIAERIKGSTPLDRAHDLATRIGEAIAYEPGMTEASTTAIEALKLGKGVCQDFAHILIAAARAAGMPARYVTGYLVSRDPDLPHEASHAWAELWVDGLGWVGFDAANHCCPDEYYLRMASGADAVDAAPIRGAYRGGTQPTMSVDVAVQQAAQ